MYWNELKDTEGILFCYFKNSFEMWLLLTYVVCNALQGSFSVLFYQSFKSDLFLLQLDLWLILAGEGVPPGNYGNYGYANSGYSACEEENDRLTESLRHKVTAIKSVSIWYIKYFQICIFICVYIILLLASYWGIQLPNSVIQWGMLKVYSWLSRFKNVANENIWYICLSF